LDLNSVYHQESPKVLDDQSSRLGTSSVFVNESTQELHQETPVRRQELSVFHNFQKHLITLFKKQISIGDKNIRVSEHRDTVLALWKAFRKYKEANKKILYVIFGITSTIRMDEQLSSLASKSKEFENLRSQHIMEAIESAQQTIRDEVISQT
jgi:hypothetical protein